MSLQLDGTVETVSERVSVPSTDGSLAGVLTYPVSVSPGCQLVVAGPHPLLGGTMENNVVRGVADGLATRGWLTLRFDYRGVGDSDGPSMCDASALQSFWDTSEVSDERQRWRDLDRATKWLSSVTGHTRPLVVVAYSFGNSVAANWLAQGGKADAIVCIAPTLDQHDLSSLANSEIAKLAVAAESDFATSSESARAALPRWRNTTFEIASGRDGHFFRGHERWLCARISDFLDADSCFHDTVDATANEGAQEWTPPC